MTGGLLSFLCDLVLIGLLLAVIVYVVRLNRRLSVLRDSRADLERLVQRLVETTARADAGLRELKEMAGRTAVDLQAQIEKGTAIRDEIHFMIEAGNKVADRLLDTVSASRPPQAPEPRPALDPFGNKPVSPTRFEEEPKGPAAAKTAAPKVRPLSAERPRESAADEAASGQSRAEKELLKAMEQLHSGSASRGQ